MEKTVFILDDNANARETLCTILNSGGYKAVSFADETSLHEAIQQRCPLAVLLDINLPGKSELEILKHLATYYVPVIMISCFGDIPAAVAAMKAGALDFIRRPFTRGDILDRLENIDNVFSRNRNRSHLQKISSLNFPGREPLTRRERDVLQLATIGYSSKQIAETLGIGYRTVEEHRSSIVHKLGYKNITELLITLMK